MLAYWTTQRSGELKKWRDGKGGEEGEISDSEQERYQKLKEEKWMEWCADVMEEEEQTLKRLQSSTLMLRIPSWSPLVIHNDDSAEDASGTGGHASNLVEMGNMHQHGGTWILLYSMAGSTTA
ncbi:hypothetical protein B296_00012139 [Ensete ventricosum]|uniref:Uncharacterized protein n=1 Tax=Ensete ventricosum TaxID=4639 RepID=A0A427B9D4_ENSVE|nr:hypothetical protein B296_00012139 [Ensete ventricosum]